ncbi:hypothetical protein RDI58_000728 [Solanum bulbocastanum]|uniref:DUF4283 domain-containing protein n=1 Tax=Solanum bulbocastanum TaxID=147425 RepID=A0AAN8U3U1_SOLBU
MDMNAEPNKKWVNFFNLNRLFAKEMSLSYINPTMKNGEKVIELKKKEVDKAMKECKQALILFIMGDSSTIAAIERYIVLQVNMVSKPKVYYHNNGYFLVRFANIDDRNETLPIWVKYPNIPLNCWSMDSLSRISSGLGEPLYVDECTTKVDRISFAWVLIEMNVAKELPRKLKVEDPNGRVFEQIVQYEWVPEYSDKCYAREGIKPIAQIKKVNKWQPKLDGHKVGEMEMQGSKENKKVPREEIWKQPAKTVIKTPNKQ